MQQPIQQEPPQHNDEKEESEILDDFFDFIS